MKFPQQLLCYIILVLPALDVECTARSKRQGRPPQNQNANQNQPPTTTFNPILLDAFASLLGPASGCSIINGGCHHICRVVQGLAKCFCQEGYTLSSNRRVCTKNEACHPNPCQQSCVNTGGSYRCACNDGLILLGDGKSCGSAQIPDVCASANGECAQTCTDIPGGIGGVVCSCFNGYSLGADQKSCNDVDECATGAHNCPAGQRCSNTQGSFLCIAVPSADVPRQPPKPSCSVNNGGCQQRCRTRKNGTIRCKCDKGLVLKSDGKSCEQLRPTCAVNNGGCEQLCLDLRSRPQCSCNHGFELQPDGKSCLTPPKPINLRACGVNTKNSFFTKIVGGKPSNPTDWPWMAALMRSSNNEQFCGGALITASHVLTAAHCVFPFKNKQDILIRLGEYNFDTADDNDPKDYQVADMKMHEKYDLSTQENDIAVIKLEKPATFNQFVATVCLPPRNHDFKHEKAYVTGWGTTSFGGRVSTVLQEVLLPIWNQTECVNAYPQNTVAESMMCAGLRRGGKDSCQGDSGGPLVLQISHQTTWYLAGIVSWGIECASPDRPGVYTRVNRYLDWIQANAN